MTQQTTVFAQEVSQVIEVTIPEGEIESQAFDVGSASRFGLIFVGPTSASALQVYVGATADGVFYPTLVEISTPEAGGVVTFGDSDAAILLPFRWLKLRVSSNAAPDSVSLTALEIATEAAGSIVISAGEATSGYIVAGDTFEIAGHPAPYTVTTTGPVGVMGDGPSISFTPALDAEVAADTVLTFAYVGDRGEAADRTIQIVTKD